jgi:hypothetical protein
MVGVAFVVLTNNRWRRRFFHFFEAADWLLVLSKSFHHRQRCA